MTRSRVRTLLIGLAAVVAGGCGSAEEVQPAAEGIAASTTQHEAGPTDDAWVAEVAAASLQIWDSHADASQRRALPVGPDAVAREIAWIESLRTAVVEVRFPSQGESGSVGALYERYVEAIDDWVASLEAVLADLTTNGAGYQREVDEAGDDIGLVMEESALGGIVAELDHGHEEARRACFDLQEELQDREPVVVCEVGVGGPDGGGAGRLVADTSPVFSIEGQGEGAAFTIPNGIAVEGTARLYLTTDLQVQDPGGTYGGLAIAAIDPPDRLQEWIDESTVIDVVEQGAVTVGGIESSWWTIVGDEEGILEVSPEPGMDWVALLRHPGIDLPQQIHKLTEIGIWEIPHPDGTVYAVGLGRGGATHDGNVAVIESIQFE